MQETGSTSSQCQCHECLKQLDQAVSAALPPPIAPSTSRPASLTIYPHLNGGAASSQRPKAQSEPRSTGDGAAVDGPAGLGEGKSGASELSAQHTAHLGFESHQALHEHLYHAFGDWDATGISKLLSSTAALLRPRNNNCNATAMASNEIFKSKPSKSEFTIERACEGQSSLPSNTASAAAVSSKPPMSCNSHKPEMKVTHSPDQPAAAVTPPLAATPGGEPSHKNLSVIAGRKILHPSPTRSSRLAAQQQKAKMAEQAQLQSPFSTMSSLAASMPSSVSSSTAGGNNGITGTGHTMADHYLKNNPFLHTRHSSFAPNQTGSMAPSLASALPSRGGTGAHDGCGAARALSNFAQPPCQHAVNNAAGLNAQCAAAAAAANGNVAAGGGRNLLESPAMPPPPPVHPHVSVGTSTPCAVMLQAVYSNHYRLL